MSGRDATVSRSTGGGKSLCFQLPALIDALRPRAGGSAQSAECGAAEPYKTAVVIVPTVSLMVDQVSQLNARLHHMIGNDLSALGVPLGKEFAALLGTAQTDPNVSRAAIAGDYRLLYLTERLLFSSPSWIEALQALHAVGRLLLLAIDEAHAVKRDSRPPDPHSPSPQVKSPQRFATLRWSSGLTAIFEGTTRALASFATSSPACLSSPSARRPRLRCGRGFGRLFGSCQMRSFLRDPSTARTSCSMSRSRPSRANRVAHWWRS